MDKSVRLRQKQKNIRKKETVESVNQESQKLLRTNRPFSAHSLVRVCLGFRAEARRLGAAEKSVAVILQKHKERLEDTRRNTTPPSPAADEPKLEQQPLKPGHIDSNSKQYL